VLGHTNKGCLKVKGITSINFRL